MARCSKCSRQVEYDPETGAWLSDGVYLACDKGGQHSSDAVCAYSYAHTLRGVPATTTIDCGPVGIVEACQKCADFYARNAGGSR